MKKSVTILLSALLLAAAGILFFSCKQGKTESTQSSPECEALANIALKAMQEQDYDTYVGLSNTPADKKQDLVQMLRNKYSQINAATGGIESYQILGSEIDPTNSTKCTVHTSVHYKGGTSDNPDPFDAPWDMPFENVDSQWYLVCEVSSN